MSNVVLDEDMGVRCVGCGEIMYKLYWKDRHNISRNGFVFTEWYGCSDCGKYIYDKHEDVYLQSSTQSTREEK